MSQQHLNRACKNSAPKPPKSESMDFSETFLSDFDEVVENVAVESEKSNYNPKIDMNWGNLPMEMRLECVKRMDFQTRCGFREVSKTEKSLVDSKKHQFEHLQISFVWGVLTRRMIGWDIIAKFENGKPEVHIRSEDRLNEKCLSAIFKHSKIKNFRFYALSNHGCDVRPILKQLKKFAPFSFKRVAVFCNRSIDFFMKNCVNPEKIDVYGRLPYKEMLNLPSLMKIKEFKLWHVRQSDLQNVLPGLVQKWIDNDAEVGKSVQFNNGIKGIVKIVARKFADRIIEKTDKEVRIRMNNGKTQILVRRIRSEEDYHVMWFCSCKVIPIDLPKSEYGKGDGWIQTVRERSQRYARLKNAPELEAEDKEIYSCF